MRAIFPGNFDPVTRGHLDLIERGARLFSELTVAVVQNRAKTPLFSAEERAAFLQAETAGIPGVRIELYSGLTAQFAKEREIGYILRGVRSPSDCAYEIPIAQANNKLYEGLETVILLTDLAYAAMSSSLIREIAASGYPSGFDDRVLDRWVTPAVKDSLRKKFLYAETV